LSSRQLSDDAVLYSAYQKSLEILSRLSGGASLVSLQKKYGISFDDTMGSFQNPHSNKTYLDNLNDTAAKLITDLIQVQKAIAQQKDGDGNMRDQLASYAKLIQQTSNPIRRTQLRREAKELIYGERLLTETVKLLSRGSTWLKTFSHGLRRCNSRLSTFGQRPEQGSVMAVEKMKA
jgi:hypothetical protein